MLQFAVDQTDWVDKHQPAECYRSLWSQQRDAYFMIEGAAIEALLGDPDLAFRSFMAGSKDVQAITHLIPEAEAACK